MAYTPGQGAASAPAGGFPTGLDYTGLGISSAELNKPIPIGGPGTPVPPDFSVARGGLNGPGNAPPPTPMQMSKPTVTFAQALSGIGNMDSDTLQKLQEDMYQARLYSRSYYRKNAPDPVTGVADSSTLAAYVKVLRSAYNSNMAVPDVIDQLKSKSTLQGVTGPQDLPPIIRYTNPVDIATAAHAAARALLGRQASASEIQAITSQYQAQEKSDQTAQQNSTFGNSYSSAASPSAFAENYFQNNNANEAATDRGLQIADKWMQMLRSPYQNGAA